ncbi:MAG: phage-related tail protein [Candidatus Paceibacteria bacterium]|jgi:phage-related tail protein
MNLYEFLDNTFIGTILATLGAGIILAKIGYYYYNKQKNIDLEYKDTQLIRELTSNLFSTLEIAVKEYITFTNIYDKKNPSVHQIMEQVWDGIGKNLRDEYSKKLNSWSDKITESSNELITKLNIENGKYRNKIEDISRLTPEVTIRIASHILITMESQDQNQEFKNELIDKAKELKEVLTSLRKI